MLDRKFTIDVILPRDEGELVRATVVGAGSKPCLTGYGARPSEALNDLARLVKLHAEDRMIPRTPTLN